MKGAKTALCNIKNVNLLMDSIKVLGVHYSYNKELFQSKNFTSVIEKITKVLQVWKSRSLSLTGKIVVFKTLAISKIVYISYMTSVPECILTLLEKIHKEFIWNGKKSKIKHSTLINDYLSGGLRDVDIRSKIKALQLSWVKRLCDDNFHPWKIIPNHLLSRLSKMKVFFPNLAINLESLQSVSSFYYSILKFWIEISCASPLTASSILSESICNNALIKIENNFIKNTFLWTEKKLFVDDFFDDSGIIIKWEVFKQLHSLPESVYFKWLQVLDSIPEKWKIAIKCDKGRSKIFCELKPHIIFKGSILPINKLSSKKNYQIFIDGKSSLPTSQKYFSELFDNPSLPWKKIYGLPMKVTIDAYTRNFQYKCLNNILYLNAVLFKMKLSDTHSCSYCKLHDETISHLFYECIYTKNMWTDVQTFFMNQIRLPDLTLQSALFGFIEANKEDYMLVNVILLTFKITLYQQRTKHLTLVSIIRNISLRERIERTYSIADPQKSLYHRKKWQRLYSLL